VHEMNTAFLLPMFGGIVLTAGIIYRKIRNYMYVNDKHIAI